MKQEINLNICAESRGNLRVYIPKTEVISMRKNVTKIAAVVALTAIVAGSSSSVAFAHHGPGGAAHTFNPSIWEAEAGGFLSLRAAWSTE